MQIDLKAPYRRLPDHARVPPQPAVKRARCGIASTPGPILSRPGLRGRPAPAARLSDRISRGVVRLSTGAWFDPADSGSNGPLEKHGNPNALTLDIGASKLSQGCIAQTCLVEIERRDGPAPAVTAHDLPSFVKRGGVTALT